MYTQVYDDGSTLTWDNYGNHAATPAPANAYAMPTNNGWNIGGDIWNTVLAQGFGKWIDYKTTPNVPQNTQPSYVQVPVGQQGGGLQISGGMLLLLGALGIGAIVLLGD